MNRIARKTGFSAVIARWLAATLLLGWSLLAFGQANPRNFDHNRTGFTLIGAHTELACEGCHVNGSFKGTPRDCASCHTAGMPHSQNNTVKPQRHVPSVVGCEVCHTNQSFVGRNKFSHNTVQASVRCETCHSGNGATGKSLQHIPVASNQLCSDCHKSFRDWLPSTFSHREVVVANQCELCHNGKFPPADGEDGDHVPYRGLSGGVFINCDTCHKASFIDWKPVRVHSAALVVRDCRECHNGRFFPAVNQPSTPSHTNAPPDCEICHQSTSNWSDVTVDVSSLSSARKQKTALTRPGTAPTTGVGTPATGTTGAGSKVKPPNHIPVPATAQCESCHRSKSNLSIAIRMDHRAVAGTGCKSCHNGAFTSKGATGARAKPANHIPEMTLLNGASMDCSSCHATAASWTTVRMDHNGSQGGAVGACKTCHQPGVAFLGNMEKRAVTHRRNKVNTPLDCSDSGCHRPQGRTGASYKSWG